MTVSFPLSDSSSSDSELSSRSSLSWLFRDDRGKGGEYSGLECRLTRSVDGMMGKGTLVRSGDGRLVILWPLLSELKRLRTEASILWGGGRSVPSEAVPKTIFI